MGRKARVLANKATNHPATTQPLTTPATEEQASPEAGDQGVYRWRDADGQWHFSDQQPAN
ncbi:DUF4124 domain-containing protein [Proteobacteria bacterium 005FR1]|nr:DUF4124 domain-containing protein [Proteobacteria bacterium 005FR1]